MKNWIEQQLYSREKIYSAIIKYSIIVILSIVYSEPMDMNIEALVKYTEVIKMSDKCLDIVQSPSRIRHLVTQWTAVLQSSLSLT